MLMQATTAEAHEARDAVPWFATAMFGGLASGGIIAVRVAPAPHRRESLVAMPEAPHKDVRLGRYQLRRQLGKGGNGQVFLAWQDTVIGEPLSCVVKFPRLEHATDEEARRAFINEARLAMRLGNHSNVVRVIDVGEHGRMPFIVMEYVDGIDLHHLLAHARKKRRPLSLPAIYRILFDVAAGLHHAHYGATLQRKRLEVVHRDVKPANVLVARDGTAKLADFGIGTTTEEGTSGQYMRGTYRYMSPEHLRCEPCPAMDVYALGIIAWEAVENRVYREQAQGTQHLAAIMNGEIPPMESDAPPALTSLVMACLDANPKLRPTAQEFMRQLRRCPDFTRDPAKLEKRLTELIGTRRRMGTTEHDVELPHEAVATLSVLDAIPVGGAVNKRVEFAAPQSTESPAESSEPPDPSEPPELPSESVESISGGRAAAPTEVRPREQHLARQETPKIRNPFFDAPDEDSSARDAALPDAGETDAPRLLRRPRRAAQAQALKRAVDGQRSELAEPDDLDDDDAPEIRGAERGRTVPAPAADPTPGPVVVRHPQTSVASAAPSRVAPSRTRLPGVVLFVIMAIAAVAAAVSFAQFLVSDNLDHPDEGRTP